MADTFGIELPLCLNFSSEIWDEAEESLRALFEFVDDAAERVGNRSVSLFDSTFVGLLLSFTFCSFPVTSQVFAGYHESVSYLITQITSQSINDVV